MVQFSDLLGKTIVCTQGNEGDEEFVIVTNDGERYRQYHYQDCCESVSIEEIVGDLDDLIGTPILLAEEVEEEGKSSDNWGDSNTYTFYKLATVKGHVTIRWLGTSNGYYSESVYFEKAS